MNVLDLIIIYLACGSPFAVFQATNREKGKAGVNWMRVLGSFLLWPSFAAVLLAGRIFANESRRKADFQNHLEDLRLEFERSAFAGGSISSLFEFRETFYRFAGLSEAVNEVHASSSNAEIFEISGHNNKSLASRCLARRNAAKVSFHRSAAREEFFQMITQLKEGGVDRVNVIELATELADHLKDKAAADVFQSISSARQPLNGELTSGLEKEVWKSRTPSTSTIN